MNKTWYTMQLDASGVHHIDIHDSIGYWGVSAYQFLQDLGAVADDAPVRVSLHSPGGDAMDGLAIYNALALRKGDTTIEVRGLAASAASIILMAGKKRAMPTNAYIMIHNPSAFAVGEADEIEGAAALLRSLENTSKNIYMQRSGQEAATVDDWMRPGVQKWFDGPAALEAGLVDELLEPVAITQSLLQPAMQILGDALPRQWQAVNSAAQASVPGQSAPPAAVPEAVPTAKIAADAPVGADALRVFAAACQHGAASAMADLLARAGVPEQSARAIFASLHAQQDVSLPIGASTDGLTPTAGFAAPPDTPATGGSAGAPRLDLREIYSRRRSFNFLRV